ncbi:MAG: hypothetical protein ACXWWA_12365 [Chitinophagaceae bacterium]
MKMRSTNGPEGEYYLHGVPEMATGFKLDEENSFDFFLIYGALDRYASGKWKEEKGQVTFQSKPWSGNDFALLKSKTVGDDSITIRITDNNENVLRYVAGSLNKGEDGSWQRADEKGFIRFPKQAITAISLISEFSPERFSAFTPENALHNYFEFRFEPWLAEVFFNDFRLAITNDGLKGKHPMLTGDDFLYKKK